ncbi:MAG: RidA family protein [Holophagaceae bacterium]|jgi:2-iminobutanoate/2-iminopropanoate deaminase
MKNITTPNAPAAIGPYSQAIVTGSLLFTSGQIALVPATGDFLSGDITEQTQQVLKNLDALLKEVGSSWDRVIKVNVLLIDMKDYATFNHLYEQHLQGARPARTTYAAAALPKGARVEIDLVAEV